MNVMHRTVVRITAQAVFGGKRVWLLAGLATLLLAVALTTGLLVDASEQDIAQALGAMAIGTLLPLFGLIVGTGVIGPEIDDGSIIHVLSKPVSRHVIVQSKLAVAVAATIVFAVAPTILAGLIMGASMQTALAFGAGALAAGMVYCVLFMLLAVLTRHAVIIGLVYALLWESIVGGFVPGARNLSVQQWANSVIDSIAAPGLVTSHVGAGLAYVLIVGGFLAAAWYAGNRLCVLTLASDD
jgi:ABC-2 type transport system permease protein